MLVAQVSPEVRISAPDPNNFTVEKRRIVENGPNKGKEQWDVIGYYGSLKSLATALLTNHFDLLLGDVETTSDLKSLIRAIDEGAFLIARACETADIPQTKRHPVTGSDKNERVPD